MNDLVDHSSISPNFGVNDVSIRAVEESADSDSTGNNIIHFAKTTKEEVRKTKVFVLLVVLFSICGAIGVFVYTKLTEYEQFQRQYQDDSSKVLSSLLTSMENSFGALNSLSTSIVTYAKGTNQSWPFVRIDNYAAQVARVQQFTGAVLTTLAPIVKKDQRRQWEQFLSSKNPAIWAQLNETIDYLRTYKPFQGPLPDEYNWTFFENIYNDDGIVPYNTSQSFYLPDFQTFPLVMIDFGPANYDWYAAFDTEVLDDIMELKQASILKPYLIEKPEDPVVTATNEIYKEYYSYLLPPGEQSFEPMASLCYPVVDKVDYIDISSNPNYPDDYEVQALLIVDFYWKHLIKNILPPNSKGIVIVFEFQNMETSFTYQIDGPNTNYLGVGDKHDPKYDDMKISRRLTDLESFRSGSSKYFGLPLRLNTNKTYTVHIYPSDDMKTRFTTSKPIIFALSAAFFIILPFLAFLLYDRKITRQQEEILTTANRSHAIVSQLYPSSFRDQLYSTQVDRNKTSSNIPVQTSDLLGPALAELYPETTVLFADVVDFTKWSSVRDPSQVFILLESLYCAFDTIANRMKVFKVETIGDCYMAVAGLPEPRTNHAEVMARFGDEILKKLRLIAAELGTKLGPGTSSLQMRIGINSGPTTAGVLRGMKGRFQLFGDTVNCAARMENNSRPGMILCSQKTADNLTTLGKQHWIKPRNGLVDAKGKGLMATYWVTPSATVHDSLTDLSVSNEHIQGCEHKKSDTVDWMTNVLLSALEDVAMQREANKNFDRELHMTFASLACPRDEVSEIIVLPKPSETPFKGDTSISRLNDIVKQQTFEYVSCIAGLYQDNPFHNFHHASHVVMSAQKLIRRIERVAEGCVSGTAHGIASDALSQFAIIFSALIHDVDHPGVSNAQLVKECLPVAIKYDNKSVAEQNSITLAWDLLHEDRFTDFRNQIMQTEAECTLFRKLIVNSVMATDLFDIDLKKLRETRWSQVFDEKDSIRNNEDCNRRATIVIEHIIQASDVCHTMQHWHVYQEWNRRLFEEMYSGYLTGRVEKDPSEGWYQGELWFFDNYIIPLARKLETCGVFGVSCGELLDYARDNRAEWAMKGRDIVMEYLFQMETQGTLESRNGGASLTDKVDATVTVAVENASFISEHRR